MKVLLSARLIELGMMKLCHGEEKPSIVIV